MEKAIENLGSAKKLLPVILSGGSGTRLWPLSRESYPKQYLKVDDSNTYSLLQETYLRLEGLDNLENPIIICNEDHRFIVAEQMRELNIKPNSIILEPTGRNTAPAIALASLIASNLYNNCLLLILSADHKIKNPEKFKKIIQDGFEYANNGRLVTFGVTPNKPETGYGYIESNDRLTNKKNSSEIKKFIEKPNKYNARKFLKDKHYSWNSGIFLFNSETILNELMRFQPGLIRSCKESLSGSKYDLDFTRLDQDSFMKCPNISFDVAVMEKTKLGTVLSLDVGWSDIGSWRAVWEISKKDNNGNHKKGKVFLKNVKDCYFRSEGRLLVGLGLKNLIVVETNDAILIANKKDTQSVKELVKEIDKLGSPEGKTNSKIYRPWGSYTSVINGERWQVKRLEIKPKSSLSLQKHEHRSEHWIIVSGLAKVEIDDDFSILKENQSAYVPLGSKHRLSNPGETPLTLIEVQSGTYLGEDDIFRFEDNYGRI